ncbi:MAG: hypothetical protein GY828_07920 [Candidatus Gracilibacteria bacterium]|nr:hypothetical protein [Candidatus Gracilibacteria bacterium]
MLLKKIFGLFVSDKSTRSVYAEEIKCEFVEKKDCSGKIKLLFEKKSPKVKHMKSSGEYPNITFVNEKAFELSEVAYKIENIEGKNYILYNDSIGKKFQVCECNENNEIVGDKYVYETSSFVENSFGYYLRDVDFLYGNIFLMTIGTTLQAELYIFDIENGEFTLLQKGVEAHNHFTDNYCDTLKIDEKNTLVFFTSDQKRERAEMYFNYYNYIYLFSQKYPEGIQIAKIGIDEGNIQEWGIDDKNLFLENADRRKVGNHKEYFMKIDLKKYL